ncbi:DNA transfer protein, partial [Escherichia coli]|nr:DNA transfer protein [Escherichia coli]
ADQARYQNLVSAEATGGLGSTATSHQLSSIAPMLYNNWLSGQMQNYGNLLNVGMNAASGQATAGQNYANNTGQLLQGL